MPDPGKRRWRRLVLLGLAAIVVVAFIQWRAAISRGRSQADEPLHIAGNLNCVGSVDMAAFLLTGPEGHVLIDGGWPESAPSIIGSIAKLGFEISDVKVLVNTDAHSGHAGAFAPCSRRLAPSSGSAREMPP